MKKLIFTFVALLTMVCGANAKTFTTTLWEGTSKNDAEINIEASKFNEAKNGDAIRITFSFTTAGSMHLCYKTGENNDWNPKAFNGIAEWPYFDNTEVTTATYVINDTDLATLKSYGMYIYGFTSSTITKVELIGEIVPTGETELLNASWTADWNGKFFAAQSGAKLGDVIRFCYSAPGSWSYYQFKILDAYGNENNFTNTATSVATSIETAANLYFDFEITNVSDMEKIQDEGFGIKGDNFTLTSVKLLTYSDSYDAVSVTIGSDGIATYSHSRKNIQVSACSEVKAYYASAVASGTVTMTELPGCIPANTGVIVQGDAGTYVIPVGSENWPTIGTNYLKPTGGSSVNVAASTTGTYHYIFAKNGSNIGFYKLTADHTLAAHKAYLETATDIKPTDPGAPVLLFFDNSTTAINAVQERKSENAVYYNLRGQRVLNPTKGLYIVNGKKYIKH